ncbi:hypothetical protein AYO20_02188 [Fonsecaea nubica]|uniref:RING-type E3 ubiquitin transferase n=1 Tax=Fonsecaea nubica TaxID=856822 RepID=A0A178D904_9EURO|nr:hypothetical protein AYO20_02188 [Fonsecaea nubica]OAL38538.1 hypothetical protein AYO20_02188 [Fonsecaea nubica]
MPLDPFEERYPNPLPRIVTRRTSVGTTGHEEGQDYCRICRGEGTSTQPLYYPCKCSGSIKFVHQECLMEWLSHSQKKYCELCKTSFRFTKLYDRSMPATLPFPLFLRQLARHGATEFARWSRYLLVSIIWTCCLPWCIRQIWRGLFWLADGNWVDESNIQAMSDRSSNTNDTDAGPGASLAASLNFTIPEQLEKIKLVFPPMQISLADVARLFSGQSVFGRILRFILSVFTLRLRQTDTPGQDQSSVGEFSPTTRRHPSLLSDVQFISSWSTSPLANHITVDVIEGQLICVLLVAAFILVFLIREWVINQQPILNMPDPDENAQADDAGPRLPPHLPRVPRVGDNVADEIAAMEDLAAQLPPDQVAPPRPPPNQRRVPRFGNNIADEIAALERLAAQAPREETTPPTLSPRRALTDDDVSSGTGPEFERPIIRTRSQSSSAIAGTAQEQPGRWRNPRGNDVDSNEPWNQLFRRHSADDTEANHYLPLVTPSPPLVDANSGEDSPVRMGHYWYPDDVSEISESEGLQDSEHRPFRQEELEPAETSSRRVSFAEVSDVGDDAPNGLWASSFDQHESDSDALAIPTPDSNDAEQLLPSGANVFDGEGQEVPFNVADDVQAEEVLVSGDENPLEDTPFWGKISHWLWHTDFEADGQPRAEPGDAPRAEDQDEERIVEDVDAEAPFVPIQNRDAGPAQALPIAIEAQPAGPAEAREPNMLFGVDLNEANQDDAEDLDGILELLGMEGPIFGMVQNVIFSLFLITVTLAASVWCPYIWGKIALLFLSSPTSMLVKAPLFVLSRTADIVVDIIFFVFGLTGFLLNQPIKIMHTMMSLAMPRLGGILDTTTLEGFSLDLSQKSGLRLEKTLSAAVLSLKPDLPTFSMQSHQALISFKTGLHTAVQWIAFTLAQGQTMLTMNSQSSATMLTFWYALRSVPTQLAKIPQLCEYAMNYLRSLSTDLGSPPSGNGDGMNPSLAEWGTEDRILTILLGYAFFAIAGIVFLEIAHLILGLKEGERVEGYFADSLRQAGGVMKVIVIIGIEMLVFPLYCGLLLDLALLPLFADATVASRIAFLMRTPLTGIFIHWFIGTCYMFHFALFVSICRKIMRKGVLYFIRDPDDPTFHPVRDVLERPVPAQLGKIAFSALVYGGLVIVCLGGVVWSIDWFGVVLPIQWSTPEPRLSFPVDIIFYNFLLPFALRRAEPSKKISAMYQWWFRGCARWLRLTNFLFGEERKEETFSHPNRFPWNLFTKDPAAEPKRDGRYVRAPASDSVRIAKGRRVFLEVTEDNERVDGAPELFFAPHGKKNPQFTKVYLPPNFQARITSFVILLWFFAALTGSAFTVGPLIVGRKLTRVLSQSTQPPNDLYAFTVGIHIFAAVGYAIAYAGPARTYLQKKFKWSGKQFLASVLHVLGLTYLGIFTTLILPFVVSLVVELYIHIPIFDLLEVLSHQKLNRDSSPSSSSAPTVSAGPATTKPFPPATIFILQSWTIGLVFLRLIFRILAHVLPPTVRPARALRGIIRNGIFHADIPLASRAFVLPATIICITLLIAPLTCMRAIIGIFHISDRGRQIRMYRFAYPLFLCLMVNYVGLLYIRRKLESWRIKIRDEVYLIESVKDRPNGHAVGPPARQPGRQRSRRSWTSWLFNNSARLATWYCLLTILFSCPSSRTALTDTSPRICETYLSAKEYIQPHLQPYYDEYAAPYVAKAEPYAHLVKSRVVRPATKIAVVNYEKYAAPQIDAAKAYSQAQWEKAVMPQINLARGNAARFYEKNIGPHVDQVIATTAPYYAPARDQVYRVYRQHLLPAVEYSLPHLNKAYSLSQDFALNTAYPLLRHAWSDLVIFMDGTFWPFVKGLYIDNVRPQLVMINERIAKYRESRQLKAAMDEVDNTQSTYVASATPSATTDTMDDVYALFDSEDETESSTTTTSQEAEPTPVERVKRPIEYPIATEEQIAEDLRTWQKKFAVAADKGSDDLRERVESIVDSLVKSDIDGVGRGLANALEKTVENELENVKAKIKSTVASLPDDASAEAVKKAAEDILGSIRSSGAEIKGRAQNVRDWSQGFEQGLIQRLEAASASTLEVLDGIKDIGLQEVGMRWSWMEGVTYKHWQKFHELRKTLDEWKIEVQDVAMKSPEAEAAIETARQILEECMAMTEDAAKELVRLKSVAQWKLKARDSSDDFGTRTMPAEAVSAASSLVSELGGAPSEAVEAASSVLSQGSDAATVAVSSASSAALGASTGTVESATSTASEFAGDAISSVSSMLESSIAEPVESLVSDVSAAAGEAYESATGTVVEGSPGTAESLLSEAEETVSDFTEDVIESASSGISSFESIASTSTNELPSVSAAEDSATTKVSKVFGGAMASEVKGSIPILDDVFDNSEESTFSDNIQSVINEAGDRYAEVSRAVSEAMFGTSQGKVESITSVAGEQYSSALAAASNVLYGTPTGTAESLASAASEQYEQAVAAASSIIFGTPTPVTESLLQQASSLYNEAVSRAEDNYNAAKSIASQQISGTPKPVHEQMFSSIESAYSGAVAAASGRLESARKSASSALPETNPLESVSSMASSILQDSLAAASAQYSKAKVAVGATPTPAHARYLQEARKNYYAAVGLAHEQYDDFVAAASSAIYGTPTPVLSSVSSVVSVGIYGTPVPAYQSLLEAAASQYSEASSAAASSLDAFKSSSGTTVQSLWDEAVAAYSSAIDAASSSLSSASYAASTAVYGTPAPFYQAALETASSQYVVASAAASSQLSQMLESASSVLGKEETSPAQSVLDSISSQYDAAISAASSSLSAASYAASTAVYGTPVPYYQSALNAASSQYTVASSAAASQMSALLDSASSAMGKKETAPAQSVLDSISSQYDAAIAAASSSFSAASYAASTAVYGAPTGSVESISSVASENWQALVAKASEQIYGTPKPFYENFATQAGEYSAQVTDFANDQYVVIQSYVSELIVGKEPDFTESVMSRLSSAYYTGYSSASSLAGEAYSSASSVASSVSSVASSYFTPPPEVSSILDSVTEQLNAAVDAASAQVYGTPKGTLEQATSVVADGYSSASVAVSEAIYGTPGGYAEAASSSFAGLAKSAQDAVSVAIYGTPTGTAESLTSAAADTYASASSIVSENAAAAASAVSENVESLTAKVSQAIYGPEQSYMESINSQIFEAVESANSRIAALAREAADSATEAASAVSESVESIASVVSKSASSATKYVKDEL